MEDSPLQALQREIETKVWELERSRANELELTARFEEELKAKEQTVEQVISDCQAALLAKTAECEQLRNELRAKTEECERNLSIAEQPQKKPSAKQEQLKEKQDSGLKILPVSLWVLLLLTLVLRFEC